MRKAIIPVRVDSYRKMCPCFNGIIFIILNSRTFGPFLTLIKNGVFKISFGTIRDFSEARSWFTGQASVIDIFVLYAWHDGIPLCQR